MVAGFAASRVLTILVFLLLGTDLLAVWWVGNGVPLFLDVGETSSAFLDGLNRAQFGFDNAGLLHDEATGPDSAAHPYLYSHNPNISRFVSYAFTSAGVDSLPVQHLFSMAITVVGLAFGYFFIKRLLGRTTALISIVLGATHYLGVLQWAPNLLRSFNILLFFGAFYYATRWRQERQMWCLLVLALFVFFIGLSDISLATVYVAALFFFLILGERKIYRVLALVLVSAGPLLLAFAAYVALLVRALGWDTLVTDLRYTYAVRNLTEQGTVFVDEYVSVFRPSDIPFLEQARRFFMDHHVTFWVLSNGSAGVLKDFFEVMHKYGLAANGPLWFASLAMWGLVLIVSIFAWLQRSGGTRPDAIVVGIALGVLGGTRLIFGLNSDPFLLLVCVLIAIASARPIVKATFAVVERSLASLRRSTIEARVRAWLSTGRGQRGLGIAAGGAGTAVVLLIMVGVGSFRAILDALQAQGADRPETEAVAAILLVIALWATLEWSWPRLSRHAGSLRSAEFNAFERAASPIRWAPDPAGFLSYVVAFSLGLLAGLALLGGYMTTFTLVPYRTLLVFLDVVLLAVLGTAGLRVAVQGKGPLRLLAFGGLALGSWLWGTTQIANTRTVPALQLAAGPILADHYRGKTFASNVYPSVLTYYTRQWVLWVSVPRQNYVFLPENVHDAIVPFQADYWDNPTKYERPDYYLCDSSSPRANAPDSAEAAPDYCRQRAELMAAHGHVPEVVADYFAIVRLVYPVAGETTGAPARGPVFGTSVELVGSWLDPPTARGSEAVTVRVRWRTLAKMSTAYKVFVHVLDPSGGSIISQRDSEPQSGGAPTTGWVPNQIIDDQYLIQLPAGIATGQYPVEIGLYDPKTNARLFLANGDDHLKLSWPLQVN
jgi:hypothetical protein